MKARDPLHGLNPVDWTYSRFGSPLSYGLARKPSPMRDTAMQDGQATAYADVDFGEAEALLRVERSA